MRDCIKTQRARDIISFMTGKVVSITDEGKAYEKICTGIVGVGEIVAMKQVCLAFKAPHGKDDGGPCSAQMYYKDWEQLISTGSVDVCDGWMQIELL